MPLLTKGKPEIQSADQIVSLAEHKKILSKETVYIHYIKIRIRDSYNNSN